MSESSCSISDSIHNLEGKEWYFAKPLSLNQSVASATARIILGIIKAGKHSPIRKPPFNQACNSIERVVTKQCKIREITLSPAPKLMRHANEICGFNHKNNALTLGMKTYPSITQSVENVLLGIREDLFSRAGDRESPAYLGDPLIIRES